MPTDPPTTSPARPGLLLVISGPSGVGKTTLTRRIRDAIPGAVFSVSATTRPQTGSETDGVDYYFLSAEEFQRRVKAGDFLEHALYAGFHYGTLSAPVHDALSHGRIVMLDIDVQGARQVRAAAPGMLGVFILPPGEDELLRRLRERRREDEESIQRRFAQAKREIAEARAQGLYDALIVNDNLDRATAELLALIHARRQTPATA